MFQFLYLQNCFDYFVFEYQSPKSYLVLPHYYYCRLFWGPFENNSLFYFLCWNYFGSIGRVFLFELFNFVGAWHVGIRSLEVGGQDIFCTLPVRHPIFRSIVLLSLIMIVCVVTWLFLWIVLDHQKLRYSVKSTLRHELLACVALPFWPNLFQWMSFLLSLPSDNV